MTVRSLIALAAMLLVVTSAAAQTPAPATGAAPAGAAQQDPVVARVNGTELHRSEVLAARQMPPAQVQQIPDQVHPSPG